ncbi:hypothetical protein MKW92_044351 [Papaver armeniacum]|nr:hypothetical protein MKW92_044351 [Papaver armeniacum]
MDAVLGISLLAVLVVSYHVILLAEGGRMPTLSIEEDLQLEAQLKSLNKLPTKTIITHWGDIYDCIEFHKQAAFDHPLVKKHKTVPINNIESLPTKSNITLLSRIEGAQRSSSYPRTTKEDLIRAKSLSSPLTSPEARADKQFRAGFTLSIAGQKFNGGRGIVNIWSPKVEPDQFSSAEIALRAGPQEQVNAIKFGWMVNPQLYNDNLTRGFVYWTGDGGHKTGCYNYLCSGYVQVDPKYTPFMPFPKSSFPGRTQFDITVEISLERETGRWWLILQDNIRMGYWPNELFPLFKPGGVDNIYWGGRVKAGKDGVLPPMASGNYAGPYTKFSGSFIELQYKDRDDHALKPDKHKLQSINDCSVLYRTQYYEKGNQIHFGGPGGGIDNKC